MVTVMAAAEAEPAEAEIHNPGTVLLGILLAVVVFQVGLLVWKRRRPRTYLLSSLCLLWILPFIIAVRNFFWRFLAIWTAYSTVNLCILKMTMESKLQPTTPRFVYRFYRGVFNVTMGLASFGYGLFLVNVFAFPSVAMVDASLTLMFYGLYFGVLSRDLIDYSADVMASAIGYYSKEGFPARQLRSNICAVCGDQVNGIPAASPQATAAAAAEDGHSIPLLPEGHNDCIYLNCRHVFHATCLRGWCLLGKKDICPYCRERVDLSLIQTNPWKDPEFIYGKLLDLVRYLVVWQPVLLFVIHIVINVLKK